MRTRLVAAVFGAAFGFLITWGQFSDPDRIREMLLLEDPYLYLMMFSAIVVAGLGLWILRRRGARTLLTGERIVVERSPLQRRHIIGAATFGVGWAIAASCPAPVAAQLAQGVGWSIFTLTGILVGVALYLRGQDRAAESTLRAPLTGRSGPSAAAGSLSSNASEATPR